MENKRFALLIDAENISAEYVEGILNEIAEYGVATYKRMYGDFTNPSLNKWNQKAIEHSIVQIQQPRYSKLKNSSDIMLVIDAMDILHEEKVEGFCIVSSDSDFTRLVNRLSEGGMEVIGMGKRDASRSLKAACSEYKNLEILLEKDTAEDSEELPLFVAEPVIEEYAGADIEETEDTQGDTNIDIEVIKRAIQDIITRKDAKGKTTGLGEIGSQLVKTYSDFDIRNYGYKSLTTFVNDMKEFKVIKENKNTIVIMADTTISKEEIMKYVYQMVQKAPVNLGDLSNKLHEKFNGFHVRDYGYTKFERFISSIPNLEVTAETPNSTQKMVTYTSVE